jgi:phospholipase C
LLPAGLVAASLVAGGAVAACSSSSGGNGGKAADSGTGGEGGGGDAGPSCGPLDGGLGPDGEVLTPCAWDTAVTQPSESTAQADRAACKFKRGDMPQATLGASEFPADIPIDNVVVLMMENHSFDSYLGHLNQFASRTDVESAQADAGNPGADGGNVPWQHAAHLCSLDTDHSWLGTANEIDKGKMDGFVVQNDQQPPQTGALSDPSQYSGDRAMWWYDQTDLPLYYQLASTFAVADHYHCSLPGPTWPNRMYLISATSFGQTDNIFPDLSAYPFPQNDASVLDELQKRHVEFKLYFASDPTAGIVYGPSIINRWGNTDWKHSTADFLADAKAGTLPPVSFVDPNFTEGKGTGTDEHPPGDIQEGQQFVGQIVQAVTTSPQWKHIALFITHDENGGFYDHVNPPAACEPDSLGPVDTNGKPLPGAFNIYGIRVLLLAVSPYAKKAYVGHHVYDHSSITRFIEAKFKLPALTGRDANAEPPTDLFDFSTPAFATPPTITVPTPDATGLSYCEQVFGK